MALEGDTLEGEHEPEDHHDLNNPDKEAATPPVIDEEDPSLGVDFSQNQREEPTLSQVYEQLPMVNIEVTDLLRENQ